MIFKMVSQTMIKVINKVLPWDLIIFTFNLTIDEIHNPAVIIATKSCAHFTEYCLTTK